MTRKIEGKEIIYKYLNELPANIKGKKAPFLIDCLNCEKGCNGGPGTGNQNKPMMRLNFISKERKKHMVQEYAAEKTDPG